MRINALILSCLVWQSFSIFFKIYFRSVGTFARALDCSSSVKQPSLHMSAAAASRDITLVSFEWLISFVVWYWSLNVLKPFVKIVHCLKGTSSRSVKAWFIFVLFFPKILQFTKNILKTIHSWLIHHYAYQLTVCVKIILSPCYWIQLMVGIQYLSVLWADKMHKEKKKQNGSKITKK